MDKRYYDPQAYLKPYDNLTIEQVDVSMNSLAFNQINNKKKAIEEARTKSSMDGIMTGSLIGDKNSFLKARNSIEGMRLSNSGKQICENILQASKDENEYFKDKKVFTKNANADTQYKR